MLGTMEKEPEDFYEIKDRGYFGIIKHHVIDKIEKKSLGHILDIGGGDGATSRYLIQQGRARTAVIIDPYAHASDEEHIKFIKKSVETENFLETVSEAKEPFQTVLCLDVLEHLVNPWTVLANINAIHHPEGDLIVCMPNARYMSLVVPLVLFGRFDYQKSGIMDRTHIRWFTRATTIELIEGAGYEINKIDAYIDKRVRLFNKLTFGAFRRFFEYQYIIQAKPRK